MLEYLVFRLLSLLAPIIPPSVAYRLCNPIGDAVRRLLPGKRRIVRRNLSIVMGGARGDIDRKTREAFREGIKYYYDTFRAPALSDADMDRLIELRGWEHAERGMARGKGLVVVTAHLGSPSLVAQILAVKKGKVTMVVEPVKPKRFYDLMVRVRGCGRIRVIPFGAGVTNELMGALRRNEMVGIVADRDVSSTGVQVRFFGLETTMPAGPVLLALRTDALVLPAFTFRRGGGGFEARICEPMEMTRSGNLKVDLRANTERLAEVMARAIREKPEQWMVFEPVWPEGAEETVLGSFQ